MGLGTASAAAAAEFRRALAFSLRGSGFHSGLGFDMNAVRHRWEAMAHVKRMPKRGIRKEKRTWAREEYAPHNSLVLGVAV